MGEQKQPHSLPCATDERSELQRKLEKAQADLAPAEPKLLIAELASCLTLVAPSGMTADDRTEWLKVARMTVGDIPAGPFRNACKEARRTCRFANEIVPTIVRESTEQSGWIRMRVRYAREDLEKFDQLALPQPEYVKPEEVRQILAEVAANPNLKSKR